MTFDIEIRIYGDAQINLTDVELWYWGEGKLTDFFEDYYMKLYPDAVGVFIYPKTED
jgi:hypothetical protein|tara:strand:+ start:366 stop:536 length:171 start_codon:yes stop_codon:yes gene_type:complete